MSLKLNTIYEISHVNNDKKHAYLAHIEIIGEFYFLCRTDSYFETIEKIKTSTDINSIYNGKRLLEVHQICEDSTDPIDKDRRWICACNRYPILKRGSALTYENCLGFTNNAFPDSKDKLEKLNYQHANQGWEVKAVTLPRGLREDALIRQVINMTTFKPYHEENCTKHTKKISDKIGEKLQRLSRSYEKYPIMSVWDVHSLSMTCKRNWDLLHQNKDTSQYRISAAASKSP